MIKQRGSIMPALFDLLYREYCRARLAEMQADSREVPEANCDASHSDGAADRGDDQAAHSTKGPRAWWRRDLSDPSKEANQSLSE